MYINDTVKAVVEIIEIINQPKRILKLDTKVFNQHDDVEIGENVIIHDYVVVYPNTII